MDKPQASSPRSAGLLTVQLGVDLKAEWIKWCAERDLVPGRALRSLVENAVSQGLDVPVKASKGELTVKVLGELDGGAKVGREIQFTPSENAAIEAAAHLQGFGFQEWVIAAVRAALAKTVSYGQVELEALTMSNARLAQIAIDLSALRRHEGDANTAERLVELESEVRKHVELVSKVMSQGVLRWKLKT